MTKKSSKKPFGIQFRDSSKLQNRKWFHRFALALGFATLGYLGTVSSIAHVVVKGDPARAHALAPSNGVILAAYAQSAFTRSPSKEPNSLPANLARRALLADPTAADALTVLAFQAQLRGDTKVADGIFSFSTTLTRRELRPRLWAIEQSVRRGDIGGALRNYDIALRTSNSAAGLLFPTLSAALIEPLVRESLLPILATDPIWKDDFITFAAVSGAEPEGSVAFFLEGQGRGLEPSNDLRVNLVNSLFSQGKKQEAWSYYRTFRPMAQRDRSRDPTFALDASVRSIFDWRTTHDTRLSSAILRQGEGGLLDFAVPPSVGGVLVSQTQLFPPGRYLLQGRSRNIDQPERSRPYWSLVCEDGREIGRADLPNSAEEEGDFSAQFEVPTGCASQTLTLTARSTDAIMGVSGQIESASLAPFR